MENRLSTILKDTDERMIEERNNSYNLTNQIQDLQNHIAKLNSVCNEEKLKAQEAKNRADVAERVRNNTKK